MNSSGAYRVTVKTSKVPASLPGEPQEIHETRNVLDSSPPPQDAQGEGGRDTSESTAGVGFQRQRDTDTDTDLSVVPSQSTAGAGVERQRDTYADQSVVHSLEKQGSKGANSDVNSNSGVEGAGVVIEGKRDCDADTEQSVVPSLEIQESESKSISDVNLNSGGGAKEGRGGAAGVKGVALRGGEGGVTLFGGGGEALRQIEEDWEVVRQVVESLVTQVDVNAAAYADVC